MKNNIRTFLIPGMGATCAMYENLYRVNPDIVGCDWPKGKTFKSFNDLAKCCIQEYGITSNDVVAGSSMGGMVACEMFGELQCRGLVLIGSCSDPRSVPLHKLSWLGSYAVNDRLLNISAQSVPWGMRLKSSLLSDPGFVKWSLTSFSNWKGVQLGKDVRVHHIHGMLDPIIPIINFDADRVIKLGGHLIAMTHYKDVGKYISRVQESC